MKSLNRLKLLFLILSTPFLTQAQTGENSLMNPDSSMVTKMATPSKIRGHIGFMQMILIVKDRTVRDLSFYDYYSLGIPMGISFPAGRRLTFDMEFVTFINPYFGNPERAVEVDLLIHPGMLLDLNGGFKTGIRGAAEIKSGSYGFTVLLNKSFGLKNGNAIFAELVLPGRFDPQKTGTYSQEVGIHAGYAF